MDRVDGACMVCSQWTKVRHLPLYVIGSEGLTICHSCEMELITFIRALRIQKAIERKEQFKLKKGGGNIDKS